MVEIKPRTPVVRSVIDIHLVVRGIVRIFVHIQIHAQGILVPDEGEKMELPVLEAVAVGLAVGVVRICTVPVEAPVGCPVEETVLGAAGDPG